MKSLKSLYFNSRCEKCEGCSILKQDKPFYCGLEYDNCEEADILFISDSFKFFQGEINVFTARDIKLLTEVLSQIKDDVTVEFTPSVKCPNVAEGDMDAVNKNICRQYLYETIEKVKPKLIFTCGNLALTMLLKKSGLGGKNPKRGRFWRYEPPKEGGLWRDGPSDWEGCWVVPVYHPYSVLKEPKNRCLFETDIVNGYNKVFKGAKDDSPFTYKIILDVGDIDYYTDWAWTKDPITIDVETTGLDFKNDVIVTVGIGRGDHTIVIPINHPEVGWGINDLNYIKQFILNICKNKLNPKIMHNAKFDAKMLKSLGVEKIENLWDTQLMSHFVNENVPHGLFECVLRTFPMELDGLNVNCS